MKLLDIFNVITVRFIFTAQALVYIVLTVYIVDNKYLLLLIINLVIIIIDGLYVIIKRNGKEFKWFSISIASYTIVFIVSNWVIVFYKLDLKDPGCLNPNITSLNSSMFYMKVMIILFCYVSLIFIFNF